MRYDSTKLDPIYSKAIRKWCEARRHDINDLTGTHPSDLDLDELADVWDMLDQLHRELGVWVRDLAVELGDRLTDRTDYVHPRVGPIETQQSQSVKWDGAAVLAGLSRPHVDVETGERLEAVPRRMLEGVLHAVKPGASSSRWNVRALPRQLLKYRTVEYGPPLPRRV